MVLGFGEGEALSNVDAAWLQMEDRTNLMVITAVMSFTEQVEFADVKNVIEDRLICHDRFRQRIVTSPMPGVGPRWIEDDTFNLKSHLIRTALPRPCGKAELEELVSNLMSTPLDAGKPLWQFHFVDNYRDGSALIARIHHSIGDGIALVRLLLSMTDDSAAASPRPKAAPRWPKHRNTVAGFWLPEVVNEALFTVRRVTGNLVEEGVKTMTTPGKAAAMAKEGARAAGVLGRLVTMSADPKTCLKGPLVTVKRCAWSEILPFDAVKAYSKSVDATINDVLLTGVAGAIRHYLISRGENVEGLDIRAVVPVNLRPDGPPGELGNKFGLVFLSLPVGTPTRLGRLRELKKRMDVIKNSPEAVVAFAVLNGLGMASAEIEGLAITVFGSKATAVMTNVPGPREPIYLAGTQVRSMMFWVPQSARLGLGVSILSYAGQVRLGVASDTGLIPDPAAIIDHFGNEMQAMISGEE
jgi:diacylglycerol O-acyltransferase